MKTVLIFSTILFFAFLKGMAQVSTYGENVVTTAVPFLAINPDARSAGMGDVGVGTSPDVASQHWNPAKYAFIESDKGISLNYTPWLRAMIMNQNFGYLVGYKRLDDFQTLSGSFRYYSMGKIVTYDAPIKNQYPKELALDVGYTRKLGMNLSMAVTFRYIYSNPSGIMLINDVKEHAGNAVASDIAFYYFKKISKGVEDDLFTAGINIQNVGSKISYSEDYEGDFLPATLKLGAGYTVGLNKNRHFSFSVEADKLLVPSSRLSLIEDGTSGIISENSSKSAIAGIFSSFTDAPGGLKEELQEIMISTGLEYTPLQWFSLRTGYFHEHKNKGNRKFLTVGTGFAYRKTNFDISYLIPTQKNNPLNTFRFSVGVNL